MNALTTHGRIVLSKTHNLKEMMKLRLGKMLVLLCILSILLAGCAGFKEKPESEHRTVSRLPKRFHLTDYPEYPPYPIDKYEDCGLAALWIVLRYRGVEVEKWKLEERFGPEKSGKSLELYDLKHIAAAYGLSVFEVTVDRPEILKALVVNKMPPIFKFGERGNWRAEKRRNMVRDTSFGVLVGYNDERSLMSADSPCSRGFVNLPYAIAVENICLVIHKAGATENDVKEALAKYIKSEVQVREYPIRPIQIGS